MYTFSYSFNKSLQGKSKCLRVAGLTKFRGDPIKSPPNMEFALGNGLHSAIENMIRDYTIGWNLSGIDRYIEIYRKSVIADKVNYDPTRESEIGKYELAVLSAYNSPFKAHTVNKAPIVETWMDQLHLGGKCVGKIDCLSEKMVIVDHKTTKDFIDFQTGRNKFELALSDPLNSDADQLLIMAWMLNDKLGIKAIKAAYNAYDPVGNNCRPSITLDWDMVYASKLRFQACIKTFNDCLYQVKSGVKFEEAFYTPDKCPNKFCKYKESEYCDVRS